MVAPVAGIAVIEARKISTEGIYFETIYTIDNV